MKWDPSNVFKILKTCAQIALSTEHNHTKVKADRSLVTQSDSQIDEYMRSFFHHPSLNSYFVGEESLDKIDKPYFEEALKNRLWIADPIDGTLPFAYNLPRWGISLAYCENGIIKEGAIFMVPLQKYFFTDRKKVYYLQLDHRVSTWNFFSTRVKELSSANLSKWDIYCPISVSQYYIQQKIIGIDNPVYSSGSCVFSLISLLSNSYMAYMGNVHLWDCAGLLPMLHSLKKFIGFLDGSTIGLDITSDMCELDFDSPHFLRLRQSLLVTHSEAHVQYLQEHFS